MPILVLTVVLTMLAVLPFSLQAESSKCDTPVGCYEEAITNYKEATAKLKTTQTDLEKARKEVDDTLAQLKDQKLGDKIAKLEQQQELKSFKVEGDINKFYPIVFLDVAWDIDPLELEINRINIHQDSQWRGSLVSKITYHANGWGNGSSFLYAEIHQTTRFIADYADHGFAAKLIVWLRGGGTTYQWQANHPATLLDYTAVDNKIVMVNEEDTETIKQFPHTRIAYESKTQVRADLDKNNVYPWDKQ